MNHTRGTWYERVAGFLDESGLFLVGPTLRQKQAE